MSRTKRKSRSSVLQQIRTGTRIIQQLSINGIRKSAELKKISKKKGSLEETVSYATYSDDPRIYTVSYRDKDKIKQASLSEFMNAEDYSPIPLTRIIHISKHGRLVWKKGQKELTVKDPKQ